MTSVFKAGYFLIFQYRRATGYLVVSLSVDYEYLGFFVHFGTTVLSVIYFQGFGHPTSEKAFQ